jgi:hypothetical protein
LAHCRPAGGPVLAWNVNFLFGSVNRNYIKATESYYVRAVRGGS